MVCSVNVFDLGLLDKEVFHLLAARADFISLKVVVILHKNGITMKHGTVALMELFLKSSYLSVLKMLLCTNTIAIHGSLSNTPSI